MLTAFISFSVTQPSEENFDQKISAAAGQMETLYLTPTIISSYAGPIVEQVQICVTLAVGSAVNGTEGATGETTFVEGPVECGAEERDMQDNDVLTITSPRFNTVTNQPAGYRGGLNCVWKINTPAWTTLELTFNYFNLRENFDEEPGWNCHAQDKLTVASQGAVEPGGYLCAQRPNGYRFPVTRALNHTFITFTSLEAATKEFGFSVTIRAIGRHRLDCEVTEIQLQMHRKYLPRQMPVNRYHLLDTTCRATDKGALIQMVTGYYQCGTIRSGNDENLYFINQASAPGFQTCSGSAACINVPEVGVPFRCKLERRVKPLSGVYNRLPGSRNLFDLPFLEGEISIGVKMMLARDLNFAPVETENSDFLDFDFQGQRVYFKVEARRKRGSAVAFVVQADQCWSTPTPDWNDKRRFDIVLNGCPVHYDDIDLGFERHYSQAHEDVFSVLAVYFNETEARDLHFHCIARVCSVGVDEYLCSKDCVWPPDFSVLRQSGPVLAQKTEAAMQRTAQLGHVRFHGRHRHTQDAI
ncbi:uncharacterized protein LOC129590636 [Paramacrobiotus metropolitanus]|uniref:uncharacterized protein LOC129590636 n=1 Tax=Paramacrobiotus metropolitanus TaxID=2943436 RepID=UPI0024461525|nr:uncharacterized protein LOC129590636 [Paramacrobiotus metropolitanus]